MKVNTPGTKECPIIPQTWALRIAVVDGGRLLFSRTENHVKNDIQDVTVRRTGKDGLRIASANGYTLNCIRTETNDLKKAGEANDLLFSYHGSELNSVYDFTQWRGRLIFATGNGLYVSTPGSNDLRRVLVEPDYRSLCPLDDRMYIGSRGGFYCLSAQLFAEKLK